MDELFDILSDDARDYISQCCIECPYYYFDGIHYGGEPWCSDFEIGILESPSPSCVEKLYEDYCTKRQYERLNEDIDRTLEELE